MKINKLTIPDCHSAYDITRADGSVDEVRVYTEFAQINSDYYYRNGGESLIAFRTRVMKNAIESAKSVIEKLESTEVKT